MRNFQLIHGDIRNVMDDLPEFHQVVTSPPYWQQRNYGGKGEIGLEDKACEYINTLSSILLSLSERMDDDGTMFINVADKFVKGVIQQLPSKLSLALSEGGLVPKSDIIWHKKRIMPQSAKNRFTCSHEYIFMFTKKPKGYTFNYEPVMEDSLWKDDPRAGKGAIRYKETRESRGHGHTAPVVITDKRICRSVWEFQTNQLDKGHSATFPSGIPLRCILAGSNKGDMVLDPFAGTCTTGAAALSVGRKFVGVDTNSVFLESANERLTP